MTIRNDTLEKLQTVYNELAPDAAAQVRMVKARNDMEKEGETDHAIMRMIAVSLYVGLTWGSW